VQAGIRANAHPVSNGRPAPARVFDFHTPCGEMIHGESLCWTAAQAFGFQHANSINMLMLTFINTLAVEANFILPTETSIRIDGLQEMRRSVG
jgi:hypothetical protein